MDNFVTACLALAQSPLLIFLAAIAIGLVVGCGIGLLVAYAYEKLTDDN